MAGTLLRFNAILESADPGAPLTVDAGALHSRARNTAFEGRRFQGRVSQTFVGGNLVFSRA